MQFSSLPCFVHSREYWTSSCSREILQDHHVCMKTAELGETCLNHDKIICWRSQSRGTTPAWKTPMNDNTSFRLILNYCGFWRTLKSVIFFYYHLKCAATRLLAQISKPCLNERALQAISLNWRQSEMKEKMFRHTDTFPEVFFTHFNIFLACFNMVNAC